MDTNTKSGGPRSRVFISYPDRDAAQRKAAFEHEIMRLLTMSPGDYVATSDVRQTMAALTAGAASSEAEPHDGQEGEVAETHAPIGASKLPRPDLSSLLRQTMRRGADIDDTALLPEILHGAHLAEALMAGRELIGNRKRRPAERAICVISANTGNGKTTLLAHLAAVARSQLARNVAVIDLACPQTHDSRAPDIIGELSNADLVVIDNADDKPTGPDRTAMWSMLRQQLPNSASILITTNPDVTIDANAPWRSLSGRQREVTIGSFDCSFRRKLIGHLTRNRRGAIGNVPIPKTAIDRLAEELWGNGWHLGAAVDAYNAYQHVVARQPTAKEIDRIAANVGSQDMHASPSIEAIADAVAQLSDREVRPSCAIQHDDSSKPSNDVVLYLAKTLTKHPLDQLARPLGLRRRAAVQAMHRIERAQAEDVIFSEALCRMQTQLERVQRHV